MYIDLDQLSTQQQRKIKYIVRNINMPRIKVKLLNENCKPERTHRWDAGWDLKATQEVLIPAGGTMKVHTGVILEIPAKHCGLVVPRSSFGTKHRITLANDIGVIDSEYRGEIMVFLVNDSNEDFTIKQYERFAQLLIVPINSQEFMIVDRLTQTDRGDGGFGSTTNPIDNLEEATKIAEERMKISKEMKEEISFHDKLIAQHIEEVEEELAPALLTNLSQSEYMKLKNTGMLAEIYPRATGNMKEDLCL